MSNFCFNSDTESFVYVNVTHNYGYGHLNAYFRLKSGPYTDPVEIKLSSQLGSNTMSHDPLELYAVRFETSEMKLDQLEAAIKFKRKLDKALAKASRGPNDGIAYWFDLLNAAISAWGIKHAHLYQSVRDSRSIPDTPYYEVLEGYDRARFFLAVREMFEREFRQIYGYPKSATTQSE